MVQKRGNYRGVGVAFRGVFPEALGKIGELLKSNSCSVEQAVSYFRRSFIYVWTAEYVLKQYQFKHTYQLRGMASTLRMRIAISPVYWQPWTTVLPLLGLIRVMVLRMCKVLAIPQSRSQSPTRYSCPAEQE